MGVFKKDGAWWIDCYVSGRRKRERIGGPLTVAMKKVASDTLAKRKVEIAENKFLDKKKEPKGSFSELADLYLYPILQVGLEYGDAARRVVQSAMEGH
ncbi:hypothetical protein ACFLQ0_00955 [Nitrospinota bacterium]